MELTPIPQAFCTCGQEIASSRKRFSEKFHAGLTREEAMNDLGLQRLCCRTQLLQTISYPLTSAQPGSVRDEVLKQKYPRKTFALLEGFATEIDTPPVIVEKEEKVAASSGTATEDLPEQLRGIDEPVDDITIDHMGRGEYAVAGYARDEKDEIVMVSVGDGFKVPKLVLITRV